MRAEHQVLDGTTLPMSDDFWKSYYPPLGWNCRCNVVQVHKDKHKPTNSTNACQAGEMITRKQPSFRFNPGIEKRCFPKTVSYYKRAGKNRYERQNTEKACENVNKVISIQKAKEVLFNKTAQCTINQQNYEVEFIGRGIEHYCSDLKGESKVYWVKNEILQHIANYLKTANCAGKKASDTSHNTNKQTRRLKKATDYFYYFPITLPNGENVVLHLGRYNELKVGKEGKMYLYAVTQKLPKNIEEP